MNFTPDRLDVKKGEQVRFILENKGMPAHELRLASVKANDDHAAMMQHREAGMPWRGAGQIAMAAPLAAAGAGS